MLSRLRQRLSTHWMSYLAVAFIFSATLLRTLIVYQAQAQLAQGCLLLIGWLLLLILGQTLIARQRRAYFLIYVIVQTGVLIALLSLPIFPDYFAPLFAILAAQIIQVYPLPISVLLIAGFTPITIVMITPSLGAAQALALGVFYAGINALMVVFTVTMQRAQRAREQNQIWLRELAESNRQLHTYTARVEGLAVARERHELARNLHDSVTQTVFSMTLTSKSALMLIDRDFNRVGGQIDRLDQLAQSAQAEIRRLIAELGPDRPTHEDLKTLVQRHVQVSHWPENFTVELAASGAEVLTAEENRHLFRIVQEALNNTVKHAQANRAAVRLHLDEPCWIEIEDDGAGFDPQQVFDDQHLGLRGMRERAAAIHWTFTLRSAPGEHTCIRLDRLDSKGARA